MNFKHLLTAAAAPLLAMPAIAHADEAAPAQSEEVATWDLSAEVGALSDYRFRGLSLSGKDPEVTAQISIAHKSGFYASAWASNVDADFDGKGNDLEVDWTAGWSKDVGRVNVNIGGIYYSYYNHAGSNYIEAFGSLGTKVGLADVTVGVAYAPKQSHIGNRDNTYVYISGDMPVSGPLSVHGTFGYENGAFGDHKKDWLVGASLDVGSGFTATLDYVDTAHALTPLGDPTVVASLKKSF
jgi:uncharacterized protein (TIGR02001 family)